MPPNTTLRPITQMLHSDIQAPAGYFYQMMLVMQGLGQRSDLG